MDQTPPPADTELKNIIDKLAQFVARNGPAFEAMTKEKQKDNPKFSFVFGGEFHSYYKFRLLLEQQLQRKHMEISSRQFQNARVPPGLRPTIHSTEIQARISEMQDKIKESEANLKKHEEHLLSKQVELINSSIFAAEQELANIQADEADISKEELYLSIQPLIVSCTKDAICKGKLWVVNHCVTPLKRAAVASLTLMKCLEPEGSFQLKLHMIYLINDVLHHCRKKKETDMHESLKTIVVPMFCSAMTVSDLDNTKKAKLDKLLAIWEKHEYFTKDIIDQLKSPVESLEAHMQDLASKHADITVKVQQDTDQQLTTLRNQHAEFVSHVDTEVAHLMQTSGRFGNYNPELVQQPPALRGNNPIYDYHHGQGSPTVFPGPNPLDDASLIPVLPYYELPAGLMAPLVRLCDSEFKPLDAKKIRLPPPIPPTERLLAALEAFYAQPNHERPRNSDGWEHNGLYEYYKEKRRHIRIKQGLPPERLERSRSRSPAYRGRWRRSRSYSRSSSDSRSRSRSPYPSRRGRRSSRSPTPPYRRPMAGYERYNSPRNDSRGFDGGDGMFQRFGNAPGGPFGHDNMGMNEVSRPQWHYPKI